MGDVASLAAEALAGLDKGNENIEEQINAALACPCLDDLKSGPCSQTFVTAFSCFMRSEHEERGMDCIDYFKDFQTCLGKNPDHYSQIMAQGQQEDDVEHKEE